MKTQQTIATLAISVLLTSYALAQDSQQTENDPKPAIVAARCQYTENANNCATTQAPRRFPAPPPRRPAPYPRASYAPMPAPSASHMAIGAMIGFTIGAVAPQNASARARLGTGLIVGLFGALIGAAVPPLPSYHRRNRWPDDEDDEEANLARHPASTPSAAVSQPKAASLTPQLEDSSPPLAAQGEPQPPLPASDKSLPAP